MLILKIIVFGLSIYFIWLDYMYFIQPLLKTIPDNETLPKFILQNIWPLFQESVWHSLFTDYFDYLQFLSKSK